MSERDVWDVAALYAYETGLADGASEVRKRLREYAARLRERARTHYPKWETWQAVERIADELEALLEEGSGA